MLGAWDKNSGAGTDMASKLAQTVSANKLANSYMAFNTNYHDTGGWVGGWVHGQVDA
jgi:processing peptidase subunit beta